nr:hypothetical protein [Bradyrhizobium forestalis]
MLVTSAIVDDQVCKFGDELDPVPRRERDGFDRTDRNAVTAAGAGRGIDHGAQLLARENANGGMLTGFDATATDHAMPFDAGGRAGDGRHLFGARLFQARRKRVAAGCERKNG